MAEDTIRLHAVVYGDVQGVGFRAATQREAVRHHLTGWVRNRWDETVETIAEGPREAVEAFERFLAHGPLTAEVDRVEVNYGEATGEFSGFNIRYF
ncbi:MAG TPA: acylphosphatase [Aggregatilineaceae bacterium]|nr:acylphosphatase [Aggregatilineaceae bacterium]